jgi:hypothetical protein
LALFADCEPLQPARTAQMASATRNIRHAPRKAVPFRLSRQTDAPVFTNSSSEYLVHHGNTECTEFSSGKNPLRDFRASVVISSL